MLKVGYFYHITVTYPHHLMPGQLLLLQSDCMLIATGSISLMMQSSSVSLLQSDSWMVVLVRILNDDGCTELEVVLQKHASYR